MQDEQEGFEEDAVSQLQASLNEGEEAHRQEGEAIGKEIKEGAELKKEEGVLEETQSEREEKDQEEEMIVEEGDNEGVGEPPTSELDLNSPAKKNSSSSSESPTEDHTPSCQPELPNCAQSPPSATKASHLSKHDKRIIEKIRSYYEAAAKAEEDEAAEESELEECGESRRRNSFSHIPSGLVKESVSRFDEFGHLGEPDSKQVQSQFNEASDRKEELTPVANSSELLADAEKNEEADRAKSSAAQSSEAERQLLAASKVSEIPDLVAPIQNSPTKEDDEGTERQREVIGESAEEVPEVSQEGKKGSAALGLGDGPSIVKDHIYGEETRATGSRDQTQSNEREWKQSSSTEPNGNTKELPKEPVAHAEHCRKSGTTHQSSWVRKQPRDLAKVSRNLDGQSKVAQWSYHSRIVTSNRALFEAMGSDVASIGLFEATPEVDPVLIENSERILSKVQTLAQMFGAKASSRKVPFHQKRGSATQSPPWGVAALPGHSLHSHSKTHVQSDHESGAKTLSQNHVFNQSQEKAQEEGRNQEEKTIMKSNSKFFQSCFFLPFSS